jgi:DNA topoisomerase VI subunit B
MNTLKNPESGVKANGLRSASANGPRLERTTFRTSREMDFFSEKGLVTQTGHEVKDWPLVVVKELIDNALDACEDADLAPVIDVAADAAGITVADNGPGLPEATLRGAMDFTVRVSNREAYVSPCRGAQGNALKTLLPMPWVVDPAHGKLIVTAHGKRHVVACGADPISQRPVIRDDATDAPSGPGTTVRLEWSARGTGAVIWPFDEMTPVSVRRRFHELVAGFAVFNPHATIRLDWFGEKAAWGATDPSWRKWKPNKPTSAHWYELPHLTRLIGAYITHHKDAGKDSRLVSDFLSEFDGLTGSAKRKKVLDETGLKRMRLSELVVGDRLDDARVAALLASMRRHSRPVAPRLLGMIGEDHLKARLLGMGVLPESFRYSRKASDAKSKKSQPAPDEKASFSSGVPWVLESAFGWLGPKAKDERRIYAGANWSAAINNPFRRFGGTGEGLETALANMRATRNEPVVFVLHLAHPRVEYTERGKSALLVEGGGA